MKDVLACLRWAENPHDRVAGFRVLQLLPGVGPARAGSVLERVGSADPVSSLVSLPPPSGAGPEWLAFASLMRLLALRLSGWPAEIEAVRQWYEPHLERIHEDAVARRADLMQLEQTLSRGTDD